MHNYHPRVIPADVKDVVQLVEYLRAELQFLAMKLEEVQLAQLQELSVAPAKPRAGMIALADGTNWNPGSGAGFYGYYGGAWVKLG